MEMTMGNVLLFVLPLLLRFIAVARRILDASSMYPPEREAISAELDALEAAANGDVTQVIDNPPDDLFATIKDYIKHRGNLPGTPESRAAKRAGKP